MQELRKHLTYSNVVATICLFLLLGGATAIAAGGLGKNTVGSKQLKKNAVTAAKIKKDAVTGAKVNESTLETVPSANLANSLAPMEATHIVGAPGQPPFEGGSSNWTEVPGVQLNPVGFYKDHDGVVHLQGVAKVGKGGMVVPIFTLPAGFRPANGRLAIFEQSYEDAALIGGTGASLTGIDLSGKVDGVEEELANLDGITFRAEG